MADTILDDKQRLDETIAAAFAKPIESGQLMPLPQTNVAISDAIITAQRVAVERDEAKVLQKIRVIANAVGEEFFYRYPVKNNRSGQTDWIEGPSIKCANNVARLYGNCQVDTRIVDNGDSWIIYSRFVDYETGFSYTRPFQQRKGQASIKSKDGDRQLDIALQIGVSKAIRNVICNALETFTNFAFDEAKNSIVEKVGKNLDRYRDRVLARLGEMGIEIGRVEAATGRATKDWLAPDVAKVITQMQAINDGMATVDETWPASASGTAPPRPTREEFHANGQAAPTTEAKTEPQGPFEIYDVTGVAVEKTELDAAVGAYRAFLLEGERHQGEAGMTTVWDNNQGLMQQLDERGHSDISKELSREYGKAREAAAARAKAEREREEKAAADAKVSIEIPRGTATPPSELHGGDAAGRSGAASVAGAAQADPSASPSPAASVGAETGDLLGGKPADDLRVPIPKGRTPQDVDFLARQLMAVIAEAPTDKGRLFSIRVQNEAGLDVLKDKDAAAYDEVMAALYRKT